MINIIPEHPVIFFVEKFKNQGSLSFTKKNGLVRRNTPYVTIKNQSQNYDMYIASYVSESKKIEFFEVVNYQNILSKPLENVNFHRETSVKSLSKIF